MAQGMRNEPLRQACCCRRPGGILLVAAPDDELVLTSLVEIAVAGSAVVSAVLVESLGDVLG